MEFQPKGSAVAIRACHPDRHEGGLEAWLGQVADILASRGQLNEALRIRLEDEIPVYERLGDVRALAVTKGKVADILARRGQLDEPQTTSKTAENVSDI